jgi:hypothetical protein
MTFEIPKITVMPGVGTIAEAGTPTETDQNAAFVSVSVLKAAGQQTFSVELLDRSNPLFLNELMNNLAAQYAKVTDTAVNAALIAGATADATTTTTYPTAAELLGVVARGAASVYSGTQGFARNIIMNTSAMVKCHDTKRQRTTNLQCTSSTECRWISSTDISSRKRCRA